MKRKAKLEFFVHLGNTISSLLSYKRYNTESYKNTVSFHRSERNPSSIEIKLLPVKISYTSHQVKFFRFLILGQSK